MNREKFEEIVINKLLNNKDDYYENFDLLKPAFELLRKEEIISNLIKTQ